MTFSVKQKVLIFFLFSLILLLLITTFFPSNYVDAATTEQVIRFSNIGGGTGIEPLTYNSVTVTGLNVNGKTLVKLSDLANLLGATISYNPYDPSEWDLKRNGQTLGFFEGDTFYYYVSNYSILDPATQTYDNYSIYFNGYTDVPSQIINGQKYVRLTTAANQLGSLIVTWNAGSQEARVFDWRVNGTTPKSDTNQYIVGGPWVSNWNNEKYTNLTEHFIINELADKSSSIDNPSYYSQLKISVNQLQSLENVRYYYNNNSSFTPTSGFRSWYHNSHTSGSWDRSFHMRGRAWDAGEDWLYDSVYNEFKGTSATPIQVGTSFWRTRVSNGLSQGYEIEQMENRSGKWLHLQRIPGYDVAPLAP